MRVLVCGGRNYNNQERVNDVLSDILQDKIITCIIHGAAKGADSSGGFFAKLRNIHVEAYLAQWNIYGKRAGMIRNQRMLDEGKPDLVVAFPGGVGTAGMVRIAKAAGVKVMEVKDE